jgi:hypothetical protein
MSLQPPVDNQDVLIKKTSRLHSGTPQSVGRLWTSDQTGAETSTWQHTTVTRDRQTFMLPAEFKPAIPLSEQPQTHAIGFRWKEEYPEELDSRSYVAYVYNCTCLLLLQMLFLFR